MPASRNHVHHVGWYRSWEDRLRGALCRIESGECWTADVTPSDAMMTRMRAVCDRCPVKIACAEYALNPDLPVPGGFYAGVWIPWRAADPRNGVKGDWAAARWRLRRLLAGWTGTAAPAQRSRPLSLSSGPHAAQDPTEAPKIAPASQEGPK